MAAASVIDLEEGEIVSDNDTDAELCKNDETLKTAYVRLRECFPPNLDEYLELPCSNFPPAVPTSRRRKRKKRQGNSSFSSYKASYSHHGTSLSPTTSSRCTSGNDESEAAVVSEERERKWKIFWPQHADPILDDCNSGDGDDENKENVAEASDCVQERDSPAWSEISGASEATTHFLSYEDDENDEIETTSISNRCNDVDGSSSVSSRVSLSPVSSRSSSSSSSSSSPSSSSSASLSAGELWSRLQSSKLRGKEISIKLIKRRGKTEKSVKDSDRIREEKPRDEIKRNNAKPSMTKRERRTILLKQLKVAEVAREKLRSRRL